MLLTAFALVLLLVAEWRGIRPLVWFAKPLASAGFVLAAAQRQPFGSHYGTLVFIAVLFSFAGDVLLIPRKTIAFLAGIVAFLLAHVWFSVAFASRGVRPAVVVAAFVVLAAVGFAVQRWLAPSVPSKLRYAVVAYIVTIVVMATLALASRASWSVPVGAVAFFISDLAVARDRFVAKSFTNKLWGLPLYYLAVHLIVVSV